ncbi:MAG: Holliday junction branch migration protein RuvA [Eubacteriaceae bacterium]|nr:Holliday junction branch migration protein RuvA [Eubacteriaceae bacterium]
MYDYIQGNLIEIGADYAVIENGGIGYRMSVSANAAFVLQETKNNAKLYTHVKIRDDVLVIYGFISKAERELYLSLNTVSGVGPKAAMAILSYLSDKAIIEAIRSGDAKLLCTAPGIGLKTAQRIIVDLKGKFADSNDFDDLPVGVFPEASEEKMICIDALISLGYDRTTATHMVEQTFQKEETTQKNILNALASADRL